MTERDKKIMEYLGEPEMLSQLAEECAELGKAALKLRRVLDGRNPTPKTEEEARADLIEEVADVYNVVGFLLSAEDSTEVYNIIGNVPYILFIAVLVLIFSAGFWTMVFALTVTGWLFIAYFIRTQVIIIRDREYNGTKVINVCERYVLEIPDPV